MNQNFLKLVHRIRERFPRLDVRTDQCDTIRIYSKRVLVGIKQRGEEFIATFIALESDNDFETKVIKSLNSTDLGDFEGMVLQALIDLVPHRDEPWVRLSSEGF